MGSSGSKDPSSAPSSPTTTMPSTTGADGGGGGDAPAHTGAVTFQEPATGAATTGGAPAAAAAGGGGAAAGGAVRTQEGIENTAANTADRRSDGGGGAAPAVPVFDLSTAGEYKVHVTGRISEGGEIRWRLPERYSRVEHIGGGGLSVTAMAIDSVSGARVVIKKLKNPWRSDPDALRAFREIRLLSFMQDCWPEVCRFNDIDVQSKQHENIIGMMDCFMVPNVQDESVTDLYIVMEHGGDDLLTWQLRCNIDAEVGTLVAYQVLRAALFMHSADIVHRDLKPANIAVSRDYDVKILDFGLARKCTAHDGRLTGYVVTRYYRAPELMFRGTNYTSAVDIWSVGCILAELLTKKGDPANGPDIAHILFPGENELQHLMHISKILGRPSVEYMERIESASQRLFVETQIPETATRQKLTDMPYFEGVDPVAIDLLEKIFVYEPEERITAAEALKHPFFGEFHDETDEPVASTPFDATFEEIDTDVAGWAIECKKEVEEFAKTHTSLPSSPTHDPMVSLRVAEKYRGFRHSQRVRPSMPVKFVYQDDPDREFTVEFTGNMDYNQCKAALLGGAQVGLYRLVHALQQPGGWLEEPAAAAAAGNVEAVKALVEKVIAEEAESAGAGAGGDTPVAAFVAASEITDAWTTADYAAMLERAVGAARMAVPFDTVAVFAKQARVTCNYKSLTKHAGRGNVLMFVTSVEPWHRAQERNDMIQQNWWLNALLALRQRGSYLNQRPHDHTYRRIWFEDRDILEKIMENQWAHSPANALLTAAGWVRNEQQACWELPVTNTRTPALLMRCTRLLEEVRAREGLLYMPTDDIFRPYPGGAIRFDGVNQTMMGAILCGKWEITQYIMSGTFGHGFKAKDLGSGKEVFIKTFRCNADRKPGSRASFESRENAARKEIAALMHLSFESATTHESIVGNTMCFGTIEAPATRATGEMFFMETPDLCEGGELFDLVCPRTPPYIRPFRENGARRLFRQLANGVAHMHAHGCFHRDLKLENLVLTRNWDLMIMDYGYAKFSDEVTETINAEGRLRRVTTTTAVGTKQTNPPEVLLGRYDPGPFDVWSCACILFFLLAGDKLHIAKRGTNKYPGFSVFQFMTQPRPNPDFPHLAGLLAGHNRDPATGVPYHTRFWREYGRGLDISPDLIDLLNQMLDVDPARRITMQGVLRHKWLQGGDDISDEDFTADMESRLR